MKSLSEVVSVDNQYHRPGEICGNDIDCSTLQDNFPHAAGTRGVSCQTNDACEKQEYRKIVQSELLQAISRLAASRANNNLCSLIIHICACNLAG